MAKRFSVREMGLLMAPVLAVGWWVSKRPQSVENQQVLMQFSVEAPTTLEAFRGANAVFAIRAKGLTAKKFNWGQVSPRLQVATSRGLEFSRLNGSSNAAWGEKLWNGGTQIRDDALRFPAHTSGVPAGETHLVFFGVAQSNTFAAPATAPPQPLRFSEKWRVDRTKIPYSNLAAMPRKPLIEVRSVTLTQVVTGNPKAGFPHRATGEVVFDLKGAGMNKNTPLDTDFRETHFVPINQSRYGMSESIESTIKDSPLSRVATWTVHEDSLSVKLNVSGRASADNRWPLGFQIEPFNFKTAKVGQKMKFKQFAVALPKP